MKTKIKLIDTSKLKFNKKEIDDLVKKFKNTSENLNKTNKQEESEAQEKYNWYLVEDYLSQVFKYKRNPDIFWWWDLKTKLNGKDTYFDSKTLLTNKKLVDTKSFINNKGKKITYPSGITNKKQKYNKIENKKWEKPKKDKWGNEIVYQSISTGYCVYLQAKQVNDIKKHCDENKVDYKDYYFIINYFDKENNKLKTVFSISLRLDNILKSLRKNENPPWTSGNEEPIDNYIIANIYSEYKTEEVN